MRLRVLAATLLIIACDLIVIHAQQQERKSTIEGTVVSAINGNPIPGARVTVSAGSGSARPSIADQLMSAIAGSGPIDLALRSLCARAPRLPEAAPCRLSPRKRTGSSLWDLDPGVYRIIADANGYVPAELGQRGTTGMGTPIYLESGQTPPLCRP